MNAHIMSGVADMGMVWLEQNPTPQELAMDMGLSCSEGGDVMMDHGSPYYMSSQTSISNHSLDDISNMTMEGMEYLPYSDGRHESSDGSYMDDDNASVFMITASTQTTAACPTRKIKPIKHPGLVLKTPIAYQGNTDPSVIPIQKDGIAICEKCGAIGVKHAFYTKERRFCSMTCARSYNGLFAETLAQNPDAMQDSLQQSLSSESSPYMSHRFRMEIEEDFTGVILDRPFPQIANSPPPLAPLTTEIIANRRRFDGFETSESYSWETLIKNAGFVAAPVSSFKHAPLFDIWDNILVGMKVEVENTDCASGSEALSDSFWVATVINIIGYEALLRYEGFGMDDSKDFWVSICSNRVHSVGWCATRGKPLIPPKTIQDRYSDWKQFLCKRLTGARTLPSNFSNKVAESMKCRFQCGLNLEVINKDRISQVKAASIYRIVGKRLNIRYYDAKNDKDDDDVKQQFWCHEDSPLIHPVGWAKKTGHKIIASNEYLARVDNGITEADDASIDMFKPIQIGSADDSETRSFIAGQKLEAVDPLNLSSICAATVMKVLRYGYIMIRIDSYDPDNSGGDWFCYHVTSPYIFPIGFSKNNGILLNPPYEYKHASFSWEDYFSNNKSLCVTKDMLTHPIPLHGFCEGMKLEATDLMDPKLVCAATVHKILGHLVRIQFDGWDHEYDQWLHLESSDIYPVGWAKSNNYPLAGPTASEPSSTPNIVRTPKKRGRKKKKTSPLAKAKVQESETPVQFKEEIIEPYEEPEIEHQQEEVMPNLLEEDYDFSLNSPDNTNLKLIPILIDNDEPLSGVCPEEWDVFDVAQFLRHNDCSKYCDTFCVNKVDGKKFLSLTNPEVLKFTGGIVGPSVKIFNLIQQLKERTNPVQPRLRTKCKNV